GISPYFCSSINLNMKTKHILLTSASALLFFFVFSCAPKKADDINTDMVDISANASGNAPAGKAPTMVFETERHDFGKITQGERVTFAFKFKNTGGSDLIINEAHGSCGCTVPDYPKQAIPPGSEGICNVEFNSEGKHGHQEKTVTFTTNCEPNTQVIYISADVLDATK
ncbi:MAG TPA: DUF1573 domain-containing protein, partial [Bacteroidia bacterium]|nr:DUF1573 domain-containing protein [Bacteroidia bacterium]